VPYRLSRELVKKGHQVTIYTSDYDLRPELMPDMDGIEFHAFRTWLHLSGFDKTPGMVFTARRKTRDFDIIHLHNYRTFPNMVMHRYSRIYGVPYVLQAHGSLPRIMSKGTWKLAFDVLWGKTILRDATRVIAVTPKETKQYRDAGVPENKIAVIPHGIDLTEFASLPARGDFRQKYGIDDTRKIVLYLGRIHEIKGLDLLLNAFAGLTRTVAEVTLVIAGPDDGYLTRLKKLTETLDLTDKIIYTGALYQRDKLGAYVDADVYVLPSRYEIFGITVLEALACGTPVIVTDRCGLADTIRGRAGLVVDYDREKLHNALKQLLPDENLRRKFGKRGKEMVRENFDWEDIASSVEELYRKILYNRGNVGTERA